MQPDLPNISLPNKSSCTVIPLKPISMVPYIGLFLRINILADRDQAIKTAIHISKFSELSAIAKIKILQYIVLSSAFKGLK